jgi:hypothetical protein
MWLQKVRETASTDVLHPTQQHLPQTPKRRGLIVIDQPRQPQAGTMLEAPLANLPTSPCKMLLKGSIGIEIKAHFRCRFA